MDVASHDSPMVQQWTERPFAADAADALHAAIYMHDLSAGGVERQCLTLARELQSIGVRVTLVLHQACGALADLVPSTLPVVDLNSRRALLDIPGLRRFIRQQRPDVFLANVDHNNIAAGIAKTIAGTKTRLVICQHNPLSATYHATVNWKHRVVPLCYRLLTPWIAHAVAVSGGIAHELISDAGLPRDKVSTIHNPVISADFAARSNAPVIHPWLNAGGPPVFITAGRLVEMKDHATLLRAFARVLAVQPARLLLLGTGPMQPALEQLVRELGIGDQVELTGYVANPLPYMRRAAAFVLSSRAEGFGNVLVEAMGCGTPVVSTDCPHGPAEILEDGRYGLLVPPRDPDTLAAAMVRVIQDRSPWPEDVLRNRASGFSDAACAMRYNRLIRRLCLPLDG